MKVQCNIVNVVALNVSPEVDQVVRWSRPLLDPPNVNDMNPTLASAVIELDTKVRNDLLKAPTSAFTFKNLCVDVKLACRHNDHKGQAVRLA